MASTSILARRALRLAVLAALAGVQDKSGAVIPIDSPGDLNSPEAGLPAVQVRSSNERKESKTKGMAEFDTSTSIDVHVSVGGTNSTTVQDDLESLCFSVENMVLTYQPLISQVQQVSSVDTSFDFSSEGRVHVAGAHMRFTFELFEAYDGADRLILEPLTSLNLHADLKGTFDATGTYPAPAFPNSVVPAPRSSGPDGRDEGGLNITLPQ